MNKAKVYIELMRPFTLIAPAIGIFCTGLIAINTYPSINLSQELLIKLFLASASAAILNGASNTLNQYFDVEIDKINKPNRPLPSNLLSVKGVLLFALGLYFLSLIIAGFVTWQFFYIVLAAVLFTYSYSGPPFRTKRFVFLSNLTIAFPRGMLPVAGWSVVKNINVVEPWAIGLIFFLFLLGAASTKDFADVRGDAKYDIKTLPIKYGFKKSAALIVPFLIFPWLLLPIFSYKMILGGNQMLLSVLGLILCFWGFFIGFMLTNNPERLAREQNHPSWKHMYLLMITAYLGITASYFIK
ncbi:MAG: hypothetical protein C4562_07335 [Actinobacteria bacterium]|nr:MAG: hypothetical protein C4562_07335 [Actinomycetota bacterium]